MKFIKLTKSDEGEIHINSMLISALDPTARGNTEVHIMGGGCWVVKEKISEIKKKIDTNEIWYKNEPSSTSTDV